MSFRDIYWCDSCAKKKIGVSVERDPNSKDTCEYHKGYSCKKKDAFDKHIKTMRHIESVANNNNLMNTIECIHCNMKFTKEMFLQHKERNQILWLCKKSYWSEFSSCNNFVTDTGKRYNSIKVLKEVMESKSKFGYNKKTLDDKYGELWVDKIEKDKHRDIKYQQFKEQRDNKLREQMENKNKKLGIKPKPTPPPSPSPSVASDDSYTSDIERPIIEAEQICGICCGIFNDDEYSVKILEHFEIKLCNCGDSTDEEEIKII